jgi:hypothetical protein
MKIKLSEKVTIEEPLKHIEKQRMLLYNILHRKRNWPGHILRRNFLLHDAMEGKMTGERNRKNTAS